MGWTSPKTWVTGGIVLASELNTEVRDNLRYLRGADGTVQIQDGLELTGTGTASYLKPPVLTTTQRDAIVSPANGMIVFNTTVGKLQKYEATAWRSDLAYGGTLTFLAVPSMAQGDIFYADTGTSIARLGAGTSGNYLKTQGTSSPPQWGPAVGLDNLCITGTVTSTGWNVTAPSSLSNVIDENFTTVTSEGTASAAAETDNVNEVQIDLGASYVLSAITAKVGVRQITSPGNNASISIRMGTSGTLGDALLGTVGTTGTTELINILTTAWGRPARYIVGRCFVAAGTGGAKFYEIMAYGKAISVT